MAEEQMSEAKAEDLKDKMLHGNPRETLLAFEEIITAFNSAFKEGTALEVPGSHPIYLTILKLGNEWIDFKHRFADAEHTNGDWHGVLKEDVPWWEWLSKIYDCLDELKGLV
jgi:hypothetical protein